MPTIFDGSKYFVRNLVDAPFPHATSRTEPFVADKNRARFSIIENHLNG